MGREVRHQIIPREALDARFLAENRQAEGVSLIVIGREEIEDLLLGVVLDHLDLLDDYVFFPVYVVGAEGGVPAHVREHVDGNIHILPAGLARRDTYTPCR